MINKKIGNILLSEQISSGGFGIIYSGIDTVLKRKVAVKVIDPKLSDDQEILAIFKQEAISHAQMNHPNIVSVYHFDTFESTYYIVFEFVEGQSLKDLILEKKRVPLNPGIHYIRQMLRGLHFAHSRNFVHFDIKPSNILITGFDFVKIIDFGISALFGKSSSIPESQWYGTPSYASPEQILGMSADFRSDIYSLGITVFHMLTGSLPFTFEYEDGATRENLLYESEIFFPDDLDKKTRRFIEVFLLKAIKRDIELRYQSVLEMLEGLDHIDESV